MGAKVKRPQDRQPKKSVAARRLHEEASAGVREELMGREIVVAGRAGTVTVSVLEDAMEWESDAIDFLTRWAQVGGAITVEVIPFLTRIVSVEDGERIKAVRPTNQTAVDVATALFTDDAAEEIEAAGEPAAS